MERCSTWMTGKIHETVQIIMWYTTPTVYNRLAEKCCACSSFNCRTGSLPLSPFADEADEFNSDEMSMGVDIDESGFASAVRCFDDLEQDPSTFSRVSQEEEIRLLVLYNASTENNHLPHIKDPRLREQLTLVPPAHQYSE